MELGNEDGVKGKALAIESIEYCEVWGLWSALIWRSCACSYSVSLYESRQAGNEDGRHDRHCLQGAGASKTPHMNANGCDPASTRGIGFPVGLNERMASALAVGLPFGPKDA